MVSISLHTKKLHRNPIWANDEPAKRSMARSAGNVVTGQAQALGSFLVLFHVNP